MNWKVKSLVQRFISIFPPSVSYAIYYWVQRKFGSLRQMDPTSRLAAGIEIWKRIKKYGSEPVDSVLLEIGTGRAPLVPIAFWLMGASKTITLDLNPYLKNEIVLECAEYIKKYKNNVIDLFGNLLFEDRLQKFISLIERKNCSTEKILNLCNIDYRAPCDASRTNLDGGSIDALVTFNVLEHISPDDIKEIIIEVNRIVSKNGIFVNRVDYTDHYSHSDKSITPVNFLQYSNEEWGRHNNKYMYTNRLRHDDMCRLITNSGHAIMESNINIDSKLQKMLSDKSININELYKKKSIEMLSATGAWIVSKRAI